MIKQVQVYFIFLFVLSVQISFGQNEDQFSPQLSQVVPVSPEAASLGKFGDMQMNLSSGKFNFTIPLYTIEVGNFRYPVYLSYDHVGLKPEEDPALVGLGWTLHADGVITRQVRGINDDGVAGYLHEGADMLSHLGELGTNNNYYWLNLFEGALSGIRDVQPDKFIVNAHNLNGSFFFNELGNVIFYPNQNYKVSHIDAGNRINSFKIIGDDGIQYYFGSREVTSNQDNLSMPEYISTWKLDSIHLPNRKNVLVCDYLPDNQQNHYFKTTYSEAKYFGLPQELQNLSTRREITTEIAQKIIKEIRFPNGKIEFITATVPNNSSSKNKYYLKEIHILQRSDNLGFHILKRYEFEYDDLNSNYKLLKRIKLFKQNGQEVPFYHFDYYDENQLPHDIHYANQDSWGFYNGHSNATLLNGNREVDLHSTRLGALKEIYYPTGGSTQIEYELNKLNFLESAFQFAGQCLTNPITDHLNLQAGTIGIIPEEIHDTLTINCDQTIRVTFSAAGGGSGIVGATADMSVLQGTAGCNPISGCSDNCSMHAEASQELGGEAAGMDDLLDGNINVSTFVASNNGSPNTSYQQHTAYFNVTAGTVLAFDLNTDATYGIALASIVVDYTDDCGEIDVGGLRVTSTKDISTNGQEITRNYSYIKENGTSSGQLYYYPIFSEVLGYSLARGAGNGGPHDAFQGPAVIYEGYFIKNTTTSQLPMNGFQGTPVGYSRIEMYVNDLNFGKKVYEYKLEPPLIAEAGYPTDFSNYKTNQLLKEQFKDNNNETKKEIISTPQLLEQPRDNNTINFSRGYHLVITDYVGFNQTPSFTYTPYYYNKTKFVYSGKEIKEGYISSNQSYEYDINTGYLKEQTTTGSDGKQIKVINIYPYEVDNLNSLGAGNQAINADELTAYQDLVQKNIIASPIQVEKEVQNNGEFFRQKLRTTYKQDLNTGYTLPDKVSVIKEINISNTDFDERIVYHKYDEYGNPVEVSKADGTHIVYIWGYDQHYPIAKIKNTTYSDVESHVLALQNASNLDDDRTINYVGNEGALRQLLDNLRNDSQLSNAMVTTYTYDPLIGVTSITDPKGDTQYYEYDNLQRLKLIKDKDGHILKEYEYHYR